MKIDNRSFELGMINCFVEMVACGVKKLALSPPLEPATCAAVKKASDRMVEGFGIKSYLEQSLLVTDLQSADFTRGKWSILYYRDDITIHRYLDLKRKKKELEDSGRFDIKSAKEISMDFMRLLSYPEDVISSKLTRLEGEDPFMLVNDPEFSSDNGLQIFIINPNSDEDMTASIQRTAEEFASGKFSITCASTPGAPAFIETAKDARQAAEGMARLIRDNTTDFDVFIIACHCDPNLETLRKMSSRPVFGIGETSMKTASLFGKFSILQVTQASIPGKISLIRRYGLEGSLASIYAPETSLNSFDPGADYNTPVRRMLEEDGTDIVVLGCAGLSDLAGTLQKGYKTPVLEPISCTLAVVTSLYDCFFTSMSGIHRYEDECIRRG